MIFYLIGIKYANLDESIRKFLYYKSKEISSFLHKNDIYDQAVLSTCNRLEIYGISSDLKGVKEKIEELRYRFGGLLEFSYLKLGRENVFSHAARVACGLDSQIKGEKEIAAQIKYWLPRQKVNTELYHLWKEAIIFSDQIRNQSRLSEVAKDIAQITLFDFLYRKGINTGNRVVVIGTGKVAELFAQIDYSNIQISFAANKNYEKAKSLAKKTGGRALMFSDLKKEIPQTDAIVSATSSPHYILKQEDFSLISIKEKIYLYDLAVPVDIDPSLAEDKRVFLQNLYSLNSVVSYFNHLNKKECDLAEYLIQEKLKEYKEYGVRKNDIVLQGGHTAQQAGPSAGKGNIK